MPCYHPMAAVRLVDGSVKFLSRWGKGVDGDLQLPCGQCIGCRLERSRQWAMRCLHESSLYEQNCFITLTYDDANLPPGGSLSYPDFQKFMKRLRKRFSVVNPDNGKRSTPNIRFYVGGEYGEQGTMRPHFHACLFNFDFPDKVYYSRSPAGEKLYTSKILESVWPFGLSSVGAVTFASAAYIARYCVQKVNGDLAKSHYEVITDDGEIIDRVPEFNHMSLKPGIGSAWLKKFRTDVYPRDYVVINGVKTKPPKYYDVLFERENPGEFSDIVARRELDFENLKLANPNEFFESRMSVKEQVQQVRADMLKRVLK